MALVPVPTIKWNLGSGSLVQFLKKIIIEVPVLEIRPQFQVT
jgi:hypothetical protein